MLKSLSTFILLIALLVSGCTIEKRLYRKGWYISSRKEWKSDGSNVQATSKSEQSKIVRQEAASVFSIDTNDLKLGSIADSVNDQLPEYHQKLPETNPEKVVGKTVEMENSPAHFTAGKVQEPGYERTKESRQIRAMLAILIGFSLLMVAILLLFNPASLTLFSLWWFVGIVLILFIGLLSIDFSARSKLKLKWVEISGDSLLSYKADLRNKAIHLSLFTLVCSLLIFILAFPAFDVMLLFSCLIVVLLIISLGAWSDYRKMKKRNTFFVSNDTATEKEIAGEPFFRKPTAEELTERRQLRFKKALFLQIFLIVSSVIVLLMVATANPLTLIAIGVVSLLFAYFSFLVWFDLLQKNKHPERERIRVEEALYRGLTPEELAERKHQRLTKAILLQVFLIVFIGLLLLTLAGLGSAASAALLTFSLLFGYFSFIIWFDLIQKNKHPEREKVRLE